MKYKINIKMISPIILVRNHWLTYGKWNCFLCKKYLKYLGMSWAQSIKDPYEDKFIKRHSLFIDRKTNYKKSVNLFWINLHSDLV